MSKNGTTYCTISEAKDILEKNGIHWTEVWIRILVGKKKIKSVKNYNSRLITRQELDRVIKERKADAVA